MEELEQSLIATLLADPSQFIQTMGLEPEMFSNQHWGQVFRTIKQAGGRVTPTTLHADLLQTPVGALAARQLKAAEPNFWHALAAHGQESVELLTEKIIDHDKSRRINRILQADGSHFPSGQAFGEHLVGQLNDALLAGGQQTEGFGAGVAQAYAQWLWQKDNPDKFWGLKTGVSVFDKLCDGLQPGEVTGICASSNMGKSGVLGALLMGIVTHRQDQTDRYGRVGLISTEMTATDIAKRYLAWASGVVYADRHPTPDEVERMALANEKLIQMSDERRIIVENVSGHLALDPTAQLIARMKYKDNVDAIFIDYVQMIKSGRSLSSYEDTGRVVERIKGLAATLEIPIVMAVQLNRSAELEPPLGRPNKGHIADSYIIVRTLDNIFCWWTPARGMTGHKGIWPDVGVFITEKRRNGELSPDRYVLWEPSRMRVSDLPAHILRQIDLPEQQAILATKHASPPPPKEKA